uniref:Uncharacterized protein n=1 Tax=Ditylenchus dipsaci TaxID=166011 RepID=A0A915EET0_9BILA
MNSYFVLISWLCFLVSIGSSLIVQKTPRLVDPASYSSVKNSFYLHTSQKDESSSEYNQAGIKYSTDYYDKMPVDHFVADSTNTFSLKYLYNMDSYKPGGPLFFYTGNEGAIELFAEVTGIMFDLAPVFNAAIVFGEHRYYGRRSSMPMGEGSLKDVAGLRYLNTQQALADYATLIPYVKTKFNISSDTPVIAFGGSYGGMLAAWFRMKYPNIVTGAWASSAPMIQFRHGGVPFDAASALIQKTFADSGCKIEAILKGYAALTNLSKTNINKLNEIFNIEAKSVLQDASDVDYLLDYIQEAFFYLAMTTIHILLTSLCPYLPGQLRNGALDPVLFIFSVKAVRYQIVSILKCWTGLSPTKSCSDGAALQTPLPAFTKVNSQFSNCNSTFKDILGASATAIHRKIPPIVANIQVFF